MAAKPEHPIISVPACPTQKKIIRVPVIVEPGRL